MLFQSWLLTILVPLTLGAPVSREPSPPTLTIMDNIVNATSPEKVAEIGKKIALGSKSRLQGSALTDEYPALGNGVGHRGKSILEGQEKGSSWLDAYAALRNGSSLNGTAGGSSEEPGKMGLNKANRMHTYQKIGAGIVGSNITLSDEGSLSAGGSEGQGPSVSGIGAVGGTLDGTLGESSDGGLLGTSSHGSGSSTASKNKAIGSKGITIDTTITGTTSASGSTVSGTNAPSPSDGTTSSTSKHK